MSFLFGFLVGGFLVWYFTRDRAKDTTASDDQSQQKEKNTIPQTVKQKERNKQKVLDFVIDNGKITNDQAQEITGASDATATRYLDELEKEGEILQKGESKGTYYVLAPNR